MINTSFRPDKRKPIRTAFTFALTFLFLSFIIGGFIAAEFSEVIETVDGVDTIELDVGLTLAISLGIWGVFVLIGLGVAYGIYRKEVLVLSNNNVSYSYTFILKKNVSIALEKINIIKVKRNLIDLIFGTGVVEIGSGSMLTNVRPEIRICFRKAFAVQFSEYLREYSQAVKDGIEFTREITAEIEQPKQALSGFKLSIRDKFLFVFTHPALWLVVPICIGAIIGTSIYASHNQAFYDEGYGGALATAILGIIASLIGVFWRAFISFYDYRVQRNKDDIKISYGLLSKKSFLVSLDKVHAYTISQALTRQPFKLGALSLSVVGINETQGSESSVTFLYPCARMDKLHNIADSLLGLSFKGEVVKPVKQSLLHSVYIPILITLLLPLPFMLYLAIAVHYSVMIALLALVLLIGCNGLLINKYARFGVGEKFAFVQCGGFVKMLTIVKTESVQEITSYAGFIRRKQGLCSYSISFRGGVLTSKRLIRNIPTISLDNLH